MQNQRSVLEPKIIWLASLTIFGQTTKSHSAENFSNWSEWNRRMAKWGPNPCSFQEKNCVTYIKGKTANLSFYVQSSKGNLKVNKKCEKKLMSHLFLERKSHIMLVHKFMNQSCLSVKFTHHVLIMALIIHHILTFCYPHVTDRHSDTFQVSATTKVSLRAVR